MTQATYMTASRIDALHDILEDVRAKGFVPISGSADGEEYDSTVYAIYALKKHALTREIEDCYFTARLKDDGQIRYTPISESEYRNY